jgi:hypothetical protein
MDKMPPKINPESWLFVQGIIGYALLTEQLLTIWTMLKYVLVSPLWAFICTCYPWPNIWCVITCRNALSISAQLVDTWCALLSAWEISSAAWVVPNFTVHGLNLPQNFSG